MDFVRFLNTAREIIYNLLFLIYILQLFIPFQQAELIISICSLLAFILSFSRVQLFYRIMILLSLLFSLFIMYSNKMFSWSAIYYFSGMTNILVLLAYASIFSIPVILGDYPQMIYRFFKDKVTSFRRMYTTFSIVTFLLCSVMGASAIPTIQTSLSKFLLEIPASIRSKFQSVTFIRGFILTLFWSPVAAAPTIAISGTGAKASILLPITFTLAMLFLIVDQRTSFVRFRRYVNKNVVVEGHPQEDTDVGGDGLRLLFFPLNIILFIGVILGISHWCHYSILDAVVMMFIPYSAIWAWMIKKGKQYNQEMIERMKNNVPQIYQQVAMFIAISVFINVIENSHVSNSINEFVQIISDYMGPFVLVIVSFIVFSLSWVGIIPQLIVVLATQTLSVQYMSVSPESAALAILGGAIAGSASSPFTMNANIVAVTLNESPMNVVKHNWLFATIILLITNIIAIFLQLYIG